MTRPKFESLESRTLLSSTASTFTESEPNNSAARANSIPRLIENEIGIRGKINALGDHDWYRIELKKGDVVGAIVAGAPDLDSNVRLVDSAGRLVVGNDDDTLPATGLIPDESPLPVGHGSSLDAGIYYVINKPGAYYLDVSATEDVSVGTYDIDLVVVRPGMESAPRGTRQTIFLDFNGSTLDMADYLQPEFGVVTFAPLANSLPRWGISPSRANAIIDGIVSRFNAKLGKVGRDGSNGDFDFRIRNSRDHADPGDSPYVSRIRIGGITDPAVSDQLNGGQAQFIDVGNFKQDDEAFFNVDFMDDVFDAVDSGDFVIHPSRTRTDLAVTAVGDVAVHELGHILGCFHTEQPPEVVGGTADLMDPDLRSSLGPDFVFGSADDVNLQFISERYLVESEERFEGVNDTLNTVAFALSTGQARLRNGGSQGHRGHSHERRNDHFAGWSNGAIRDGVWSRLQDTAIGA
jgi:hypothetical protein